MEGTALITGASSGIGQALARVFAKHGHNVILVARSEAALRKLAEELETTYPIQASVYPCDLSQAPARTQLLEQLRKDNRTIDILVNNAGLGVYGPFCTTAWEDEASVLQVNMVALTHLTHALLPGMIERKQGAILNIGSLAGFYPGPLMPTYYASKAYVLSFSEALAHQTRKTGVHVTAYCVGPTRTDFARRTGGDTQTHAAKVPLFATPEQVAIIGYQGLMAKRRVLIPGARNRAVLLTSRLLPRATVAALIGWSQERFR